MTSTNELGLSAERIRCPIGMDLDDLHCSTICEDILWKPVSCQQCETHFCSKCIAKWLKNNPNQCPLRCDNFNQRPCSKFIVKQLAKLEVVPYEALEKHEMMCGYQRVICNGCQLEMLQKNVIEHQSSCSAIVAKCDECKMIYKRAEVLTRHSDLMCLKKQLRDLQQESQYEIQQLKEQLRQVQNDQATILVPQDITGNAARPGRTYIQSTNEVGKLNVYRVVSYQELSWNLYDRLFCSKCRNILWSPVSCSICGITLCERCRPQQNVFNPFKYMLQINVGVRHERSNCNDFREVPAPTDIISDLERLQIYCAYAPNGCQVISLYNELEAHEKLCEFEMVPCQLCQLPLSGRPPVTEHTLRICFEEMTRKYPIPIQQQLTALLNANEKVDIENRNLRSMIDNLQSQLNTLDAACIKKNTSKR
ncbi:unnamed protein product [Adineta ricciae]|uniref:Uncharacterized protein n=1 Tax=Adineta ricciae TaxID=249248 RepID=A0A815F1J7_ADIRI|nr:unnamed protein product [Adineta ricciae]CAF1319741.1 unnamed protein product [Adineta ricciae]